MRTIAIVLNALLLGLSVFLLWRHGFPDRSDDQLLAALITTSPVASLLALWGLPRSDLLTLYLRRKALEEQAKIDALKAPK